MKVTVTILIAAMLGAPAIAERPISKFDTRPTDLDVMSKRSVSEIERCLIDVDGWPPPHIYRQPDRPNHEVLVWVPLGSPFTHARVDLEASEGGTHVRAWKFSQQARICSEG